MTRRATVVGGGITGLSAARALAEAGVEVTVLEAAPRLGGRIEPAAVGGATVEAGPDAFLARVPEAVALAHSVGLADELVAPASLGALVWSRGRLRPFPEGVLLGVPTDIVGVARSGILSPWGVLRAGFDLVLPAGPRGGDVSVAALVGGRFGREVVDRLVDPLIGGINAGRSDELSAEAVAPQVVAAARASRSLLVGARSQRVRSDGPVFLTVRSGLAALVERMAAGLDVRVGHRVSDLDDLDGDVILTVPAAAAAELVQARAPGAADDMRGIRTASVGMVLLAYDERAVSRPLDASGFVVPRAEGRLLTACSFATSKWPHWKVPGRVVLRASVGRSGDDRWQGFDDSTLVERVHEELAEMVGLREPPIDACVRRWIDGFPQYDVGHLARVERIERALPPGVVVAGASYRGLGLPACIRQGQAAALRLLEEESRSQ